MLTPEELEKAKKFKTDPFADIERFAVPIHEVAPMAVTLHFIQKPLLKGAKVNASSLIINLFQTRIHPTLTPRKGKQKMVNTRRWSN